MNHGRGWTGCQLKVLAKSYRNFSYHKFPAMKSNDVVLKINQLSKSKDCLHLATGAEGWHGLEDPLYYCRARVPLLCLEASAVRENKNKPPPPISLASTLLPRNTIIS